MVKCHSPPVRLCELRKAYASSVVRTAVNSSFAFSPWVSSWRPPPTIDRSGPVAPHGSLYEAVERHAGRRLDRSVVFTMDRGLFSLEDLLRFFAARGRALDWSRHGDLRYLMYRAAKSIAALHHVGIVHRDIKPANFVLFPSLEGKPTRSLLEMCCAATDELLSTRSGPSVRSRIPEGVRQSHFSLPSDDGGTVPFDSPAGWVAGLPLDSICGSELRRLLEEDDLKAIDFGYSVVLDPKPSSSDLHGPATPADRQKLPV